MIGLSLRLAVGGGREAIVRLITIAAAVALGTGLLIATLAGINAVNAQNTRYVWLNTAVKHVSTSDQAADPLWWLATEDYYHGADIARLDLAATGPSSPVPPGIPALPGPGEYYASPAMAELLSSVPADELADRYPGHLIGTIGAAALPAPNSLIIVIGQTPRQVSSLPSATKVTSIAAIGGNCAQCVVGIQAAGMDLILGVIAGALLFPLLIFIGAATRLTAARREQRFAAMRLVGATPRQVSILAAGEATVAAVVGTVLGFALFYALRVPLAAIPFTGSPFYPADLSLNLDDILAVALGVPAGAAIAARLALRRVRISPLGVSRRVTPRPPRAYRLIPLILGVGELSYFIGRVPHSSVTQVEVYLPGFLIIMGGLVYAGPWLTMVGARLLARRARRPAALIAARRLADSPQTGFRAISGLVVALFVTSVTVGVITTIVDHRGIQQTGAAATALSAWFDNRRPQPASVPEAVQSQLRAIPGVRDVLVVRANPDANGQVDSRNLVYPGLISCADLAADPAIGRCPAGATVVSVWPDFVPYDQPTDSTVWPAATTTVDQLAALPVASVVADTDGSRAAIERARTVLENAYPDVRVPSTENDFAHDSTNLLTQWQQLANVIILTTLPIAGLSLAVSVAGGLAERKRPFSLLRLSGVPLRVLRRVVALESAVPLLIAAVVAVGAGLGAAQLFLRAQMDYTLSAPGVAYYLIVIAGIAVSLGIIGSTLPLLERITGPETARNE